MPGTAPLGRVLVVVAALVLGLAAAPAHAAKFPQPDFADKDFHRQALVSFPQVQRPTAVAFAPDGRMFIADDRGPIDPDDGSHEKGELRVLNPDGTVQVVYDFDEKISEDQDRGFTGLALDKDFDQNGHAYLLYTYEHDPSPSHKKWVKTQRLVRVKIEKDNTVDPASEVVLLGGHAGGVPHAEGLSPYSGGTGVACPPPTDGTSVDCIPSDASEHSVDSVVVDPNDGTLWVSIGDGGAGQDKLDPIATRAMDVDSMAGKILHIDKNGNGLASNPFCPAETDQDKVCRKVYAMGLRNPFRFSLRPDLDGVPQPADHKPVVGDVGWKNREELEVVQPGKNYGWPCYEGSIRTPDWDEEAFCNDPVTGVYVTGGPNPPGAVTPPAWEYAYDAGLSGAIIGGPTYTGDGDGAGPDAFDPDTDYPASYIGNVFVSDYVRSKAQRLQLDGNGALVGSAMPFANDIHDLVGWAVHPSGDLVYANINFTGIEEPAIYRVRYGLEPEAVAKGSTSADPTPRTVVAGPAPLTVNFTSAGSTDPADEPLTYAWDFDGNGTTDSTAANPSHTYTDGSKNVTATLTVTSNTGTDTATVLVSPGNQRPTASMTTSGPWRAGGQISLTSTSTDPDGNALTYSWDVKLKHNTHFHDGGAGSQPTLTFIADEGRTHVDDAGYVARLTVTDSRGISSTKELELIPETAPITVTSDPEGALVDFGSADDSETPHKQRGVVGARTPVSAQQTFTRGGRTYVFKAWNDGGARSHEVEVAPEGLNLVASYDDTTIEGKTFHVAQGGSGTACTAAAPCSVSQAIGQANATATSLDEIRVSGALSTGAVNLNDSPIVFVGSGRGAGGTSIVNNEGRALQLGSRSSASNVRVQSFNSRTVNLQEGAELSDATLLRTGTDFAAGINVEKGPGTGTTRISQVSIEQNQVNGEGAGIADVDDVAPGVGDVTDRTVVDDVTIKGPAYGVTFDGGRLTLRRTRVEAEENAIDLDVNTTATLSSVVLRALPPAGGKGYFNAVKLNGGSDLVGRHVTIEGGASPDPNPDSGPPTYRTVDGLDVTGSSGATSTVDLRHSVITDVYTAAECTGHGQVRLSTTRYFLHHSIEGADCGLIDGGGNVVTAADAKFVDAENGDLRPAPDSPLIDAAGTEELAPGESPTDVRGAERIADGDADGTAERDMGAYEIGEPPVARFTATPARAIAGTEFVFDASASTPGEDTITAYQWDLDGDSAFETETTAPTARRSYATPGTRTVRLRVVDGRTSAPVTREIVVDPVPAPPTGGGDGGGGQTQPPAPGPTPPAPLPEPPVRPAPRGAPAATIVKRSARVTRTTAIVRLSCARTARRDCAGTLRVELVDGKRVRTVLRIAYKVKRGKTLTIRRRLPASARRTLRANRKAKVRFVTTVARQTAIRR